MQVEFHQLMLAAITTIMLRIAVKYIIVILFFPVCFSSCTLLRPLPLEAVNNSNPVQKIEQSGLSAFDGNYQIVPVDSSSNSSLDYVFTYKSLFKFKQLPGKNDYLNLSATDDRHIKATLFVNGKKVKSKTVTGRLKNNYFEFHSNHFSLKYIFILYAQQTNRLALSQEGDLYLDNNSGGIGFLLILPVPLSGSSMDTYNLKFKRQ
jgi:hypothetical protein